MPPDDEPTAALTSRSAVVAAVLLLGAIIVMVFVVQGGSDSAGDTGGQGSGPVLEGVEAPEFVLTSLEGEEVSLSDYAGRPVLVNFWASWCPPCREEFPVLIEAHEAYADAGFEILGVTHNDQADLSQKFVDDAGSAWPILQDPDDAAYDRYGPVGLPTSYFIDAEGVVQRVHIGPMTDEQLASHLTAIDVAEPPQDGDATA